MDQLDDNKKMDLQNSEMDSYKLAHDFLSNIKIYLFFFVPKKKKKLNLLHN